MAETYVFSIEPIKRAVSALVTIPTHEHLAAYLAILYKIRRDSRRRVYVSDIKEFHDQFLKIDGDRSHPYISPFRSRGIGNVADINPNIAGSYAPSSLRPDAPIHSILEIEGRGRYASFSLQKDHAVTASREWLHGRKLPVIALTAFLFRDYGFQLERKEIARVSPLFRDRFGLRSDQPDEASTFNILFVDDVSQFSDADLVPAPRG